MKFISYNVNGIKAYVDKGGLDDTIEKLDPDLICFQETKADDDGFDYWTSDFKDQYKRYHENSKFKKGYAGLGIMIHNRIHNSVIGVDSIELEGTYGSGRILRVEFKDFYFVGVYTLNSGDKDDLRLDWDKKFSNWIKGFSKPVIIMGDLNVVDKNIDYWSNLEAVKNTLPGLKDYERSNFTKFMSDCSLIDSFRYLHPDAKQFSWFSYMGRAYESNKGWRIDYSLVSKSLLNLVTKSTIHDEMRWSDHVPIELELNYE